MVSLGLNQSPDMAQYMFHQITKFTLTNLHCQRKITIDGSRKTINFIVLPYSIKSPYFMGYNAIFVFKHTKYLTKFQNN